ncbi:MAG: transglutaminase domain-containing protein [Promethearchaeota archaeon]|nr:MAG: transglutaminase domain-containing protein [Candidatus Lokiarchaeota archaeon]
MSLKPTEELNTFLIATKYCDFTHHLVIKKAKKLTKDDENPKDKALNIFYFVRDQIKFMIDDFIKASETLKQGKGDCGIKTNLQVALLRAINIPARFHVAALSKESLKGVVPDPIYRLMPDVIKNHPWCECYLSGNWIACDTLFDKSLVKGIYKNKIHNKEDIPTIDWDGRNNLNTMKKWIIKDKGFYASLDEILNTFDEESPDIPENTKKALKDALAHHLKHLRQS